MSLALLMLLSSLPQAVANSDAPIKEQVQEYLKGAEDPDLSKIDHIRSLYFGASIMPVNNGEAHYGFNIGDVNQFDQSEMQLNNYRYGFGYGALQLGNGVGINLQSSSGLTLLGIKGSDKVISPLIGAEFGGKIVANTNGNVSSYYQWFPGFSAGLQVGGTTGVQMALVGKGGIGLGNWGRRDLWPDGSLFVGGALYLNTPAVSVGLEHLTFGSSHVYSANLMGKYENHRITFVGSTMAGRGLSEDMFMILWSH